MTDPITLAAVIGAFPSVASQFGLGIASNEAHLQLRNTILARARGGLVENHDIAKAVRSAQLAAIQHLVDRHGQARSANPPKAFLAATTAGLDAAQADLKTWPNQTSAPLLAAFDRAFITPDPTQAGPAPDAVAATWAEVQTWAGATAIPPAFEAAFHGHAPGALSWFQAFAGSVAEQLKTQPRLRDALFAGRLVETRDLVLEGQVVWARIEDATVDIRADMGRLRREMHGRFDHVDGSLRGVAEGVAALQAIAEGLSSAQVVGLIAIQFREGLPPDTIEANLRLAPGQFQELRASLTHPTNDEPRVSALREQANVAIEALRLDQARDLLLRAAALDATPIEDLESAARSRRLSAAASYTQAAKVSRLAGRLLEAADSYSCAAELAEPVDREVAKIVWIDQANALEDHANLFGGVSHLQTAIAVLRDKILPCTSRTHRPAEWAGAQNNLGNALSTLGERAGGEVGIAALNDAVTAYRAALSVRRKADMPADWSMTLNNLGTVLWTLGARAGGDAGIAALNDAVTAYRAALSVRTQTHMPAQWAMTQDNLGIALRTLGERSSGQEGLEALNEAVAACRAALTVRTEAGMPAQWAMTQNNLSNALQILSSLTVGEKGLAALHEAIAACAAALTVNTETSIPIEWAATQNNLGTALWTLGERVSGDARRAAFDGAVAAFHSALTVRTETDMPADWAATTQNLALADAVLAEVTGDLQLLDMAIGRMDEVISAFHQMQASHYLDSATRSRGTPGVNVDFDEAAGVVGLDIDQASGKLNPSTLETAALPLGATRAA